LAKITKDGRHCLVPERCWRVEYRDVGGIVRRKRGYADKQATEQLAARLERHAARQREGMVDPFEEHLRRPLADHLADYRRELQARNNEPHYVALVVSRVTSLLDGCQFHFIADLSASRVMDWLADLRNKGRPRVLLEDGKEWFTLRETGELLGILSPAVGALVRRHHLNATGNGKARRLPRATVETLQDRLCRGASVQTSNYYLSHLKSFCRWLVKDRRMGDNPLIHLEGGNGQLDRRHDRRELTNDELLRLLAAARASSQTFRGMTGYDRFVLYASACGTGFRAGALASLTPESFALDDEPPNVSLAARKNKSRKLMVQPIPFDLTELLRDYLREKPPGQPVWGGTWRRDGKAAEMLRIDLESAGIPYVIDGPDGPLFADFHALRHSYITALGRAGVDLRTTQELAGHSTPILTARYSHRRLQDLAGAVEKLPQFLPDHRHGSRVGVLRRTGTDGQGCVVGCVGPDRLPLHSLASARTVEGEEPATVGCHNSAEKQPVSTSSHQPASPCISTPGGSRTPPQKPRENRVFPVQAAQIPTQIRPSPLFQIPILIASSKLGHDF
jgi:integrase